MARQEEKTRRRRRTAPEPPVESAEPAFELMVVRKPPGLIRRALAVNRQLAGLFAGGIIAHARARADQGRGGPGLWLERLLAFLLRPFVRRDLRDAPFAVQLRRRLELLGPTYIKLGQILSLREDLLPHEVTEELKHLLNRLPAVSFEDFTALVEDDLGRPIEEMYAWVDEVPLGSASIAQIHRATTREGDAVVIKAVKPGIRETLRTDARLLRALAGVLQLAFPRYQPRRIIHEFVDYTQREVDLRREADNAENFAANFVDEPDIVFPVIYREYSGQSVLTMEFFDGLRPDGPEARELPLEERRRLVDLGAAAIIRMIYQDGVFHADLHPGNLVVLPGPKAGFIDLGMVGRLDHDLRRTLLYYYYCLVTGDTDNAARYLAGAADSGRGGDPHGFRREVAELSGRWRRAATFDTFSLGQLILESVTRGAQYRMYFPVEMVLMVKALITFEGVGQALLPGFNVAEVSERHVRRIFIRQFSPIRLVQEELRGAPELLDALIRVPQLVTEGLRVLEKTTRRRAENPLSGLRGTLLAGCCLVSGAIIMAFGGPWPVWGAMFAVALLLAVRRGE
jgi:ubiquinone biosynthesis protein